MELGRSVVGQLVVVELVMGEQGGDKSGGLLGEAPGFKVGGHEGVGTVVEHALGVVVGRPFVWGNH